MSSKPQNAFSKAGKLPQAKWSEIVGGFFLSFLTVLSFFLSMFYDKTESNIPAVASSAHENLPNQNNDDKTPNWSSQVLIFRSGYPRFSYALRVCEEV